MYKACTCDGGRKRSHIETWTRECGVLGNGWVTSAFAWTRLEDVEDVDDLLEADVPLWSRSRTTWGMSARSVNLTVRSLR